RVQPQSLMTYPRTARAAHARKAKANAKAKGQASTAVLHSTSAQTANIATLLPNQMHSAMRSRLGSTSCSCCMIRTPLGCTPRSVTLCDLRLFRAFWRQLQQQARPANLRDLQELRQ